MTPITKTVSLTDSQVIDKAWKLISHSDVKSKLPPRYTLRQLHDASTQVMLLGAQFIEKYGDRLKELDSTAWIELKTWKDML